MDQNYKRNEKLTLYNKKQHTVAESGNIRNCRKWSETSRRKTKMYYGSEWEMMLKRNLHKKEKKTRKRKASSKQIFLMKKIEYH